MENNENIVQENKKKLNVKRLGVFCACILVLIVIVVVFINSLIEEAKLKETVEYKLGEIGYSSGEIKVLKEELEDDEIDKILKINYNKNISMFIKEKYFIFDNLDKYLDYFSDNSSDTLTKVVSIVNTGADNEWYSNIKQTDVSKNELMLVNKFYCLGESYEPSDLIKVSSTYGFEGKRVSESIYDSLTNMLDAAKENGYTLLVNQGYRSYADQLEAYNDIENVSGAEVADNRAARAGHSEYQTGLSVELSTYGTEVGTETQWLLDNSYRFGFIVRYPENMSDITGFTSDAWRVRYVGRDVATKIHNEGITFDEYYAYYLNK